MNRSFLGLWPLFSALLLLIALSLGLFGVDTPPPQTSQMINRTVMPFHVPLLESADPKALFGPELWNKDIVVLNVFASWCKPCEAEHSAIMKLAKSGKVRVLGLAWKDKPGHVIDYIRAHGNPYQQIGIDSKGSSSVSLNLSGVPETFLFDTSGRVVYNYKAPITEEMVDTILLPMIEKLRQEAIPVASPAPAAATVPTVAAPAPAPVAPQ